VWRFKLYQAIESFSEIGRNDAIKREQSKLVCICRAEAFSQFSAAKLAKKFKQKLFLHLKKTKK